MRMLTTTCVFVAALSLAPIGQVAASQTSSTQKSTTKVSTPASHATTGVVKSIDDATLVITKSGKTSGAMTFVLDPSTEREGSIQIGSPVSVRYHADGKKLIASAVAIRQPKQPATHATSTKKS